MEREIGPQNGALFTGRGISTILSLLSRLSAKVQLNNGQVFLGVLFKDAIVHRVRIEYSNSTLGPKITAPLTYP